MNVSNADCITRTTVFFFFLSPHLTVFFHLPTFVTAEDGDDVGKQTATVLRKIDALLAEAGTSKENVLKAEVWLASMKVRTSCDYLCRYVSMYFRSAHEEDTKLRLVLSVRPDEFHKILVNSGCKQCALTPPPTPTPRQDFDAMNRVYDQWVVPGRTPARCCGESALARPDLLVEIVITAAVPV